MERTRKKNTRQRGSHTHGGGSMKKRRGAGHRGGRGKAGSGKRGDAKKPSFWNDRSNFVKKGFKSIKTKKKSVNIESLHKFGEAKLDLTKLGYEKLLGKGTPTQKYDITVKKASKLAIEKIEKAGGKVNVPD